MANEGSTKPTYSDDWNDIYEDYQDAVTRLHKTEAELARVRGLLQRLTLGYVSAIMRLCPSLTMRKAVELALAYNNEADAKLDELGVEKSTAMELMSQGAESADIGKLDSAEKKMCKCGHSDEEHDDGRLCCSHRYSASLFCSCNQFALAESSLSSSPPPDK